MPGGKLLSVNPRRSILVGLLSVTGLVLLGCATPVNYSNVPLSTYNKDTEYAIEQRDDGFAVTVYYSRYQMIPESSALATACKSALTSIAWEIAEKHGKQIDPINEHKIRISMGRNGVSCITSCTASATAKWRA